MKKVYFNIFIKELKYLRNSCVRHVDRSNMKKRLTYLLLVVSFLFILNHQTLTAHAANDQTILDGVFVRDVELSGLTLDEAKDVTAAYVEELANHPIVLRVNEETTVEVLPSALGFSWSNQEILEEAASLGKSGNIIARYKAKKDLERENKVYEMEFTWDESLILQTLELDADLYNVEVVNTSMVKNGDDFTIIPGSKGYEIDLQASAKAVLEALTTTWTREFQEIPLVIATIEPKGTEEELLKVRDILGSFTTSYTSSNGARSGNVENGCALVDGALIYPGETFSIYDAIKPFTEDNGYLLAGSYLNGKVVDSLGGGICQVSTTLYNAVLKAELEVTERHNHSMMVAYVQPAFDAAIAESSGKDFKFVNNTNYPIYIEGITSNKKIYFTIYGVDERSESRKVTYVNEVVETITPGEAVVADPAQGIGSITTEAAHTGYKAKLWKVVTVNGVEESRTLVNSSNYKMTPKYYLVGTASADPNATAAINEAIATGNIIHVRNVIAALSSPDPNVAAQAINEANQTGTGNPEEPLTP